MRTITEKLALRLKAQAKEAKLIGLTKIASHLDRVAGNKTRSVEDSYTYASQDLQQDIEGPLWDVIVRIADYYDCSVSPELMQKEIQKISEDLIKVVSREGGIKHGVGAYEPTVPGEVVERVTIEVE